jgi:hypothetical protein
LTLEQFKSVVDYIIKLYQECRKKKAVSGEHDHFGAYIGGHAYLLYFFECLRETGGTTVMNCAYAELDSHVQCTSSDPAQRRFHIGSSYASDHSISPMPSTNLSFSSQKQSAVAAAEDAANFMIEKQKISAVNDRFDRMMEMSDKFDRETTSATYYQYKYKEGKESCASEREVSVIEFKYKRAEKKVKIFGTQYEKMKSDLGYKLPEESDGSLSSDSNDSDTEKQNVGYSSEVAAKVRRCLFAVIGFMLEMLPLLPRLLEDTYTLSS